MTIRNCFISALALLPAVALLAGCSSSSKSAGDDLLTVDMLADIDRPDFDETSVTDIRYSLLDTTSIP